MRLANEITFISFIDVAEKNGQYEAAQKAYELARKWKVANYSKVV